MSDISMNSQIDQLRLKKQRALAPGSAAAIQRQHSRGKLTARERIDYLLDEGSFQELDMLARSRANGNNGSDSNPYTDGVITGFGTIKGKKVCIFSQDFTVFGGALGEVFAQKIHKVMDLAQSIGVPMIGLNDGAGARIQEGVVALHSYGEIFSRNVSSSGVIPQISVILGPCAGGAVYSPAMTDFVFMVASTSHMFITGPDVVKAVTGEDVSIEQLGGALSHASRSGVATFVADNEFECLDSVAKLLQFLPSNYLDHPIDLPSSDDPMRLIPEFDQLDFNQAYDIKKIISSLVDDGDFFEYFSHWARNLVCGFAHIGGQVVGIVANQPQVLSGVLDIDASEKGARFIRTCDAFGIAILTIVDVPGFMPGVTQEKNGLVRRGAKLLYAFCEASVPRVQLIVHKAYGGAYVMMDSKAIGADLSFAWPSAELAVMDPQGLVDFFHFSPVATLAPQKKREELISQYYDSHANPYMAAEMGYIDDVIEPSATRTILAKAFRTLKDKKVTSVFKKHPNLPL